MSPLGVTRFARAGVPPHPGLATAVLLGAVLVGGAACTPVVEPPTLPTPAEIPELEAHLAADPASVPVLVRLGVAYREADRFRDARAVLERAAEYDPTDPAAVYYLGLTYEDLYLPAEARQLYLAYQEVGRSAELKRQLVARLPLLERQEFALAVREALVRETELAAAAPEPRTVAVFPFLYLGDRPDLQPLSRALAELLVTDLSQTDRMRVLERSRVQLLLDELELGESGLVDPYTAVRGGQLLRAEHIVQGQIEGDERLLRLQAAVVGIGAERDDRPIAEQDALRRLFELEKRLALGIYRALGVELTPAERERVLQRPTESLEALLAYGECLEREDAGDFAGAALSCARAADIDPGFGVARDRAGRLEEMASAARTSTREMTRLGTEDLGQPAVDELALAEALEAIQLLVPDPAVRDAFPEAQGSEGIGRSAVLEIILRRP